MVHSLQVALEKAFPYCNDLSQIGESGFNPHLSVGQFPKNEVKKFMTNFQDNWKPIEFTVSEVFLINRGDFDSPFKVYYRVPFGNEKIEEINPLPTKKEKSSKISVFVGNLPFTATELEVEQIFQNSGVKPSSINLVRKNGQLKGFGFVEFNSEDEKNLALKLDKQLTLSGRTLAVQPSNP